MCGIFGFTGFDEAGLLKRMKESLLHRGPDAQGFHVDKGTLSMGNCRLSIIDLEGGNQPIYNEDQSIIVCYNGEIYNYLELMEELKEYGHCFQTRCDTEVIVHAYEQWGLDCIQKFNGMFAIALYDLKNTELILIRDRVGQKPLYYWKSNGKFIFASEIKAILESIHPERCCNYKALDAYLGLRYVPGPETMFAGIHSLQAAHLLRLKQNGEVVIRRYWDIEFSNEAYKSEDQYLEKFEEKFYHSVKQTMRSDVPVAAYLSGGVDSSLLVAAMMQQNNRVRTYSIGFNSPVDETTNARETAKYLGSEHNEIHCKPDDFELFPKVVWHMDLPVGDALIIAFFKLAEAASRDTKVVISGEGADEIFAGYSFHKLMMLSNSYHRFIPGTMHRNLCLPFIRSLPLSVFNRFFEFPANLGKHGKKRFVAFFEKYSERNIFENYISLKTLWDLGERKELYTEGFKQQATDAWIPEVRDNGGNFLDRLLKLQYDEWLQDWICIRQDKNTMASSLEIRLPFLDHELMELAFKMPKKLKIRGFQDKVIERRLAKKLLPPVIANRTKKPFFFPLQFFFEHKQAQELLKMTLNEEQVKRRGYFKYEAVQCLINRAKNQEFLCLKQVMSLVILELWHQIFIDRKMGW